MQRMSNTQYYSRDDVNILVLTSTDGRRFTFTQAVIIITNTEVLPTKRLHNASSVRINIAVFSTLNSNGIILFSYNKIIAQNMWCV